MGVYFSGNVHIFLLPAHSSCETISRIESRESRLDYLKPAIFVLYQHSFISLFRRSYQLNSLCFMLIPPVKYIENRES